MAIKESSKIIILMRHAARAFDGDHLSLEGRTQASQLRQKLASLGIGAPARIQSSPKNRTQQTLRNLSNEVSVKIEVDARLDERESGESFVEFEDRVKSFLGDLDGSMFTVTLACSHLDWLEAAALLLSSDDGDLERAEPWSPMAIRAYMFNDGIWKRIQNRE